MENGKTPASRPIEVTVISGEDLVMKKKAAGKNSVYVNVKTGPFLSYSTGVDPEGRSFPSWNERFSIDLPEQARSITVEAPPFRSRISAADACPRVT